MNRHSPESSGGKRAGLALGLVLFFLVLLVPAPEGISPAGWRTVACALLMATWWITEAIPIAATALIPLVLFPLLGILQIKPAASPYANPVIFLFLGGFMIAAAIERCGLHRRLALAILRTGGTGPMNLVGGFMIATAFLSMWVSNTATVVMMLPTAMSVIRVADREMRAGESRSFGKALLLGLAYAANIGGMATLIGTPPNALLAGFMLETYGVSIGFGEWMLFGVPLVALALPLTWFLLVRVLFPLGAVRFARGRAVIDQEMSELGKASRAEWIVGSITALVALSWIFRPLLARAVPGISDAGIAIAGALLLFAVPVAIHPWRSALDWENAERLPWGVLILFGGGLSLAAALSSTGVAEWIGDFISQWQGLSLLVLIVMVTAIIVFLTELTSNTATAATFLPIVASIAIGLGGAPLALALPAAISASCAFMMPVATPPNAIVYGSGRLVIAEMARAGIWINLFMIILVDLMVWFVGLPVLS